MKTRTVSHVPMGYQTVTPYLSINGTARAIAFYKKALGAKEVLRIPGLNGTISHAEIEINGHRIMLADEYPAMNFKGPQAFGGSSVHIHLYVKNVDAVTKRAVNAGATLVRPVQDHFYGDRSGSIEDPFGHVWHIATHTRDVSMKELKQQAAVKRRSANNPDLVRHQSP